MRQRGVFWWTAVVVVALGSGCTDKQQPSDASDDATPTLDAGESNNDASYTDVTTDTDADGIADFLERAAGDTDTDGDGIPDYRDPDDDGDGIPTSEERGLDSDNDGAPNYVDADDDGDGTPTKDELAASGGASADSDGDGVPDYLDDNRLVEQDDAGTIAECAQSTAKADLHKKPVDIVFIIDNSSSMASEIQAVQNSVNADFAKLIGKSGIDYRVIMLADFGHFNGAARSVCIDGELNPGQSCPNDAASAVYGLAPVNSARFFHYDADGVTHDKKKSVDSLNSMCRALEWFDKPDGFNLAPHGWGQWLRKEASKVFVEISDDHVNCSVTLANGVLVLNDNADMVPAPAADGASVAQKFDQALRGLSSEQFGSEAARNYTFHSIISMPYKAAMSDVPYASNEPIAAGNCASGEHPGTSYEAMSRMTDGLRFPICAADAAAGTGNTSGFTAIFSKIAQGVVEGTKVACELAVPMAPVGKTLDRGTVEVVYSAPGADAISFRRVQDIEGCAGQNGSFYFRADTIQLCSDTCTRVQLDDSAKLDVRFGCTLPPRREPPPLPPPSVPE